MQPNNCSPSIHGLKTIGVVQPEWLRVNDAVVVFGLSRPHLFRAIVQDRVKSVHIKNPGAKKGIRLIEIQSLRNYINTFSEAI
ncbi:MAG: hypothetical protein WB696_10910 [Chthoniobacterales bacterium]|jgi:hypothetical protein